MRMKQGQWTKTRGKNGKIRNIGEEERVYKEIKGFSYEREQKIV